MLSRTSSPVHGLPWLPVFPWLRRDHRSRGGALGWLVGGAGVLAGSGTTVATSAGDSGSVGGAAVAGVVVAPSAGGFGCGAGVVAGSGTTVATSAGDSGSVGGAAVAGVVVAPSAGSLVALVSLPTRGPRWRPLLATLGP